MPHAAIAHVDQVPVVGLEREPHVELQDAVAALQQPVAARRRQDDAAQLLALEGAARHGRDAPASVGRLADIREVGIDLEGQGEKMG